MRVGGRVVRHVRTSGVAPRCRHGGLYARRTALPWRGDRRSTHHWSGAADPSRGSSWRVAARDGGAGGRRDRAGVTRCWSCTCAGRDRVADVEPRVGVHHSARILLLPRTHRSVRDRGDGNGRSGWSCPRVVGKHRPALGSVTHRGGVLVLGSRQLCDGQSRRTRTRAHHICERRRRGQREFSNRFGTRRRTARLGDRGCALGWWVRVRGVYHAVDRRRPRSWRSARTIGIRDCTIRRSDRCVDNAS